jgi:bacterioferritin-associated ferredoxin
VGEAVSKSCADCGHLVRQLVAAEEERDALAARVAQLERIVELARIVVKTSDSDTCSADAQTEASFALAEACEVIRELLEATPATQEEAAAVAGAIDFLERVGAAK